MISAAALTPMTNVVFYHEEESKSSSVLSYHRHYRMLSCLQSSVIFYCIPGHWSHKYEIPSCRWMFGNILLQMILPDHPGFDSPLYFRLQRRQFLCEFQQCSCLLVAILPLRTSRYSFSKYHIYRKKLILCHTAIPRSRLSDQFFCVSHKGSRIPSISPIPLARTLLHIFLFKHDFHEVSSSPAIS